VFPQKAFEKNDFSTVMKASRRVVKQWPLSDYAPQAQYLLGRSYEAKNQDQYAFREYQKLLEKYPKVENYQEVLLRQYGIANRFLAGQWFRLWGYIPFFPSMDKTVVMYEKLIRNGPYSEVAPQAQMKIGSAREKQSDYSQAVRAYERAADRYHDQKTVAADALYRAGLAYYRQAKTAEYDQNVAGQAIATFSDFIALYPTDARVAEAQKLIQSLKTEQARGSYEIARYYERKQRWNGALIYYNEVLIKDPESRHADEAKSRIDSIKKRAAPPSRAQK
jgi:outer membrane assembly lipoprotein YfiO